MPGLTCLIIHLALQISVYPKMSINGFFLVFCLVFFLGGGSPWTKFLGRVKCPQAYVSSSLRSIGPKSLLIFHSRCFLSNKNKISKLYGSHSLKSWPSTKQFGKHCTRANDVTLSLPLENVRKRKYSTIFLYELSKRPLQ